MQISIQINLRASTGMPKRRQLKSCIDLSRPYFLLKVVTQVLPTDCPNKSMCRDLVPGGSLFFFLFFLPCSAALPTSLVPAAPLLSDWAYRRAHSGVLSSPILPPPVLLSLSLSPHLFWLSLLAASADSALFYLTSEELLGRQVMGCVQSCLCLNTGLIYQSSELEVKTNSCTFLWP